MCKIRKIFLAITVCVAVLFATACGSKEDSAPFVHGLWDTDSMSYTSEYLGIRFNFPLLWFPIGDENLATLSGIEDMSESSMKTVLDQGKPVYESIMMNFSGKSIMIMVYNNTKNTALSKDNFFDEGQTFLKGNYIDGGYICTGEKSSVKFLGKNTDCLELKTTKNGKSMYYITVPVFKGNYTACIEFGAEDKSDLTAMITMASAI